MIQVRAPNGTVIRFPDGTPGDTINQVMGQYHAQTLAAADAKSQIAGAGPLLGFLNGRTFNFAPEVMGAAAAFNTGADNLVHTLKGEPKPYGAADMYRATAEAARAEAQAYARSHPGVNLAANVVGAINPATELGANFVGTAKGVLPAVGRSALVGAGEGAAYGAGAGGPHHRATGAAQGAAVGAVTAGAVPVVGRVAQGGAGAAGAITQNVRRAAGAMPAEKTAQQRLAAAIAKDVKAGVDPQANLDRWAGVSTPSLADVSGENVRALVRDAGSQGPARNTLQGYRDQVASNLQDHAINLTTRLTPDVRTPAALAAALRDEQTQAANRLYPAFAGDAIPVDDQVRSALSGMTGSSAITQAQRLADALRDADTTSELASLKLDDLPAAARAGTLDLIRRGMRDAASEAFKGGANTLGSALRSRAGDLETPLMSSPGFDVARKSFEDYAKRLDAIDSGGQLLNLPPSQYSPLLADASPEALQAAQVGSRQALIDAIGRPTEGATGVLGRIATATNPGQNLQTTFGADAADAYRAGLGDEVGRMRNANFMAPNVGSQTNAKGQDLIAQLLHGPHVLLDLAKNVVSGGPLTDAERAAIVSPSIGDIDPKMLADLIAARRAPALLPGVGYANAPLTQVGVAAAQGN